jgi:type IV pilus assembly protein PilV
MEDMMLGSKNTQSGFSLIEMMIAVFILAVGLLGLAELQITAMRSNSKSGSIVAASSVAKMAVEEILAVNAESDVLYAMLTPATADLAYVNWPSDADTSIDGIDDNGIATLSGVGSYLIQYKSTPDYPTGDSGITLVEIRVTPQGGTGMGGKPIDLVVMKDLNRIYND